MFKIGDKVKIKPDQQLVESLQGETFTVTCVLGDLIEISDGTNRKVVPEFFIEKLEAAKVNE